MNVSALSIQARSPHRPMPLRAIPIILLAAAGWINAAPGDPDPSFGFGGTLVTHITRADYCESVALQADGKIVAAGYSGTNNDFTLVRYLANGKVDSGFGTGGKVVTPIGTDADQAHGLIVQSDGRIIVGGTGFRASYDFALVRYNTDGSKDPDFGASGVATIDFRANSDNCQSVVVQSDGRIVAAGSASNGSNYDFGLVCYQANGTLDSGFGSGGKVVTPFGTSLDSIYDMAIQSDGMIVAVGMSMNGTPPQSDFALARYHSNGTLDSTFGSGGKVTTPIGGGDDYAYGVAIQSDGRILVAGDTSGGPDSDFLLLRFEGDAPLDNDMDGVMDAWETANGFSPAIAFDVFNLDSDGDGDHDLLEIYQGTGRNDPGQRFGLQEPAAGFAPGSHQLKARIRRASQTAVNATLLWSTDLTNWHGSGQSGGGVTVAMTEAIVGSGTGYQIAEITATVSAGSPAKLFLRMRVEPND